MRRRRQLEIIPYDPEIERTLRALRAAHNRQREEMAEDQGNRD